MGFHQTPSFQQSEGHGQPIKKKLLTNTKQELLYKGTQIKPTTQITQFKDGQKGGCSDGSVSKIISCNHEDLSSDPLLI